MPKSIKIDLKEINQLTMQMRHMHRSALPNAVRNTLNDTAFHAKKNELKTQADKSFINRTSNFFKAKSGVVKANGFDLRHMVSEMGMSDKGIASQNLKEQNDGGKIEKRAFIPTDQARIGKSPQKKIARRNRMSNIKFVDSRNTTGNRRTALVRTVAMANKLNKNVLYNGTVFMPKSVRRSGRNLKFRLVPLYSYKKGRSVNVKGTNFMDKTGIEAQKKQNLFFKNNFEEQVKRLRAKGKL